MKISKLKKNPNNPRTIKDFNFERLCNSIENFPEMMKLKPIVVDNDYMVLAGNMRLAALKHLGYKDLKDEWVVVASELTEEQKREFIIKDNVNYGDWDWDMIANEWETEQLKEWGLDVWDAPTELDYSELDDDDDIDDKLDELSDGVRKSILIEFEPDHYDEALETINFWRSKGAYVGKIIFDY